MRFSYNFKNSFFGTLLLLLICLVLYLYLLIRTSYFATHFTLLYIGIFALLILALWYFWRLVSNFEKGQEGEMKVDWRLAKLPSNYYSLHDVTLGNNGNIDEVVIAPTGIWTIEVKNSKKGGEITFHNGLLLRNGYPLEGKDLKQAYHEALELQNFIHESLRLSLPVSPVLVFANPKDKVRFGLKEIQGVQVIGINWLINLLKEPNMPIRLTPEQCVAVRDEMKKHTSIV
jgi:Nuclease-related domain